MKNLFKVVNSLVLMLMVSVFFAVAFDNPKIAVPIMAMLFVAGFAKGILKAFGINAIVGNPGQLLYDGFIIQDTTYAGEKASQFIVKAITGNETIQGGHVYVKDGIKKAFTIPRWDADYQDFVQDRAATPSSKGSMTTDGHVLTPADYMIYTEFDPRDYEAHWYATQLNPTLIDRALPPTVESVVVQQVLKRHDRYLNKALWVSDKTLAANSIYKYWNGFIKNAQLANSGTDQTVLIGATTLTAANIQGELLKGYSAIPAALRYDADMKFFMNFNTYDLYMQSQIAQQYKGRDITQNGVGMFKGREVVKINDLPDNFYFIAKGNATPESNMWVGMNSVDDAKLKVAPVQANSENWFIKMLMKVDVQIGWNSETVLYI